MSAIEGNVEELPDLLNVIKNYSDNPSAFLALNTGNSFFTQPGIEGIISYRRSGSYLVQIGGAFAPADQQSELLAKFKQYAAKEKRKIVAIQLQSEDLDLYSAEGFTVNQVGASYAVNLGSFTLKGSKFMQLRNKISRATRAGLVVAEVPYEDWRLRMHSVDSSWLKSKGKNTKPLEFLVGECGGSFQERRRLFVGVIDGELVGYISYSPVYGRRSGWLHDLSRKISGGPPGIMEAINRQAISAFQAEAVPWLHFGFTPFTGLKEECEPVGYSKWFRWVVGQLSVRGDFVYPSKTQLAYKHKWEPEASSEYIAFSDGASIIGFLNVFRAANAL
ncbi:hypothetical protein CH293_26430 [Rhodococcus sp. 14-2470-1b]|uniref:bifunctional lysylphosphatidylglycerol flippase/synthetase MprF n=1 Tax=Rhodococcus sp. 14-2470-1b TaxID=2023149 RepID=UPI000B9BEC36|nr:DUF2156 domain-containing protein [Rhodococcus sp. 14-2470-1b]OZF42270.1 hypothetical protein CH293_26430 [Rhodococcus sp. 14-2470-1b]